VRVEDVDEDDENRFEQRRQDLIYTDSSIFWFPFLLLYPQSITQTKLFDVFGC